MAKKGYVFIPKDQTEANRIAHWLSFRGIAYNIGELCGSGRPCIVPRLTAMEFVVTYLACGRPHYINNAYYYAIKRIAC